MAKMVLGWQVTYAEDSARSYREHVDVITHISPCWYSMDARGEIKSEEEADTVSVARSAGTILVPLIVNEKFSPEVAHEFLLDEDTRRRAAKKIANEHVIFYEDPQSPRLKLGLVKGYGIDGIAFWRLGMEDPRMWAVIREEFLV